MISSDDYERALRGASAILEALNGPVIDLKPREVAAIYRVLTSADAPAHRALYDAMVTYVTGARGWHKSAAPQVVAFANVPHMHTEHPDAREHTHGFPHYADTTDVQLGCPCMADDRGAPFHTAAEHDASNSKVLG